MEENITGVLVKNKQALDILQDKKTIATLTSIKGMFADHILERGDLRFLVLDTISEKPKNGYRVIVSISKRFLGMYKPSPGVIYPSLQSLEEEGLIDLEISGKKKIYSITKKGKKELAANKSRIDEITSCLDENVFGRDEKTAKKMEEILKSWVGLAYEVFYKNLKNFKDGSPDTYEKMVQIEKLLKSSINEVKKI